MWSDERALWRQDCLAQAKAPLFKQGYLLQSFYCRVVDSELIDGKLVDVELHKLADIEGYPREAWGFQNFGNSGEVLSQTKDSFPC